MLILLGLTGFSHAVIGYGLFLVSTLLLLSGVGLLSVFALTNWHDAGRLRCAYRAAFWMGAWAYVIAVAALSGYFVFEAFAGQIFWPYVVFGPTVLAAIIIFDVGIWRIIVERNLPTVSRFGELWQRESLDKPKLRQNLIDEVILHRTLLTVSPFRWLRHQLIF